MYSNYPALMGEIATSLIASGHADEFVEWHRREALERNRLARKELELDSAEAVASYHLWVPLPETKATFDVVADIRSQGVLVSPPEKFTVDHQSPPHAIRLALGSAGDRERLLEGLRRVSSCVHERPSRFHNVRQS